MKEGKKIESPGKGEEGRGVGSGGGCVWGGVNGMTLVHESSCVYVCVSLKNPSDCMPVHGISSPRVSSDNIASYGVVLEHGSSPKS